MESGSAGNSSAHSHEIAAYSKISGPAPSREPAVQGLKEQTYNHTALLQGTGPAPTPLLKGFKPLTEDLCELAQMIWHVARKEHR